MDTVSSELKAILYSVTDQNVLQAAQSCGLYSPQKCKAFYIALGAGSNGLDEA